MPPDFNWHKGNSIPGNVVELCVMILVIFSKSPKHTTQREKVQLRQEIASFNTLIINFNIFKNKIKSKTLADSIIHC